MEKPAAGNIITTFVHFSLYAAIFVVALCSVLNYLIYTRTVQRWEKTNMPFLHPMFLTGHKYFLKGYQYSITVIFDRIYKEHESKDVVAFFMFTKPVVLIKDIELIRYIFSKNFDKTYQNGPRALEHDIETQNMFAFATNKMLWKTGRALMMPAFSPSKMQGAPEFAKIKKQMDKVLKYVENLECQPIDVCETAKNFIIDSLALWGLAKEQNSFQKKTEFYEFISTFFACSYARMLKLMLMIIHPAVQNFRAFQFVGQKYKDYLKTVLTEQIEQRRRFSLNHNDVIDHFMSLKNKDSAGANEGHCDNLPEEHKGTHIKQLIGYSLVMFTAIGTAPPLAIIFTLHLLSLYPKYQDKIKEEVEEIMVKHQVTAFTAEVVKDLQFTEQCIYEAERLFPLAPSIVRHCTDDIQMPGRTFSLKKGDTVMLSPYSMHRDPKYFKDPDKFYPERFSPLNRASILPEVFLAFGYGPKKCPGYKQAYFMATLFVAALVQKYEIHPYSHLTQMDATDFHSRGIANHPKKELFVKLVRR